MAKASDPDISGQRDNKPPAVLSLSSEPLAMDGNHPGFVFTFDENIELTAAGGNITIVQASGPGPALKVPVSPDMISGNVLTIPGALFLKNGGLKNYSTYRVTMDAGAVQDLSGNSFDGIPASGAWMFTTANGKAVEVDDPASRANDFNVFPNPFVNQITVTNADRLTSVIITNVIGQRVKTIDRPSGQIDTSDLKNGVYYITLVTDNQLVIDTKRLVKR
ncbi:T9SS type A sorting domain-containing protein [Gaoshiqia sp. Z1-71]|uniref:T9SS type A sorting domain-containing protein n=1 Tax=Gaoshiqia hydrogeniformans TaxID=3290090 RepID=UPI003BF92734